MRCCCVELAAVAVQQQQEGKLLLGSGRPLFRADRTTHQPMPVTKKRVNAAMEKGKAQLKKIGRLDKKQEAGSFLSLFPTSVVSFALAGSYDAG